MNTIASADQTIIAYDRAGSGTPLLLVHGTNGNHMQWNLVLPYLSAHFTVYTMERRGRGQSGDAPDYAIQREFEDVAALAGAIGKPVDILGHSFGAACVLGAARLIPNLRRMMLYEPPMLQEQQSPQRAMLLDRMEQTAGAWRKCSGGHHPTARYAQRSSGDDRPHSDLAQLG